MARLDRQDWIQAALGLLAAGEVADLKIEPLAAALGVTKGSFYWHFDDRSALLSAVLDAWVEADTDRVIELVAADADAESDPEAALRRLVTLVLGPPTGLDGTETAIRAWAAADPEVAATVADVDRRRLDYVQDLLVGIGVEPETAGRRAHLLYRIIIGEYLWRRYDGEPLTPDAVTELIERLIDS